MVFVEIDKNGIDECYQAGLVKPNEFRQICSNLVEQEISLRLENLTLKQKFKMFLSWIANKNYILSYYQELSDSHGSLLECIIEIAGSTPEHLLLSIYS